jgi:predicted acylesterase/phospholipase RssA
LVDTLSDPGARSRIGLALAGGGPEGAIYEIGALRALDEALDGFRATDLHAYVGVSAGSFIAGCVANGMSPEQLCRAIVHREPGRHPFRPEIFFTPALKEFVGRTLMTPRLAAEALWDRLRHPLDRTLVESLLRLTRALPVGLFDNEPIRAYLHGIFTLPGREDDFRELSRRLIVVASDLDSGEAVRFGAPGLDHVPISQAIQASCALPGLYPPVRIDDRYYVDGVLLKTLHASVALEAGTDLLFCINPIVPVDVDDAVRAGVMRRGKLIHRGLPTVLSQTFRTLVHSRLVVGLASYEPRFPQRDVVLIEPSRDDYRMFFTNVFSFTERKTVCEHAYRATRRFLCEKREQLEPVLARHGIRYRDAVLDDPDRSPWPRPPESVRDARPEVVDRLEDALSRVEELISRRQTAPDLTARGAGSE